MSRLSQKLNVDLKLWSSGKMRRGLAYSALLFSLLCGVLYAQEKKEPETRRVELPASPQGAQQNPPLPKIELPEYIITGIVSLSVPDVHKENAVETARLVNLSAYHANVGARERETVELENRQKEALFAPPSVLNGQVTATLGSYFTPRVDFWLGQTTAEYDYRVSAGYHRTKGYVQYSDRSGGNLEVSGGVLFNSGALYGTRLGGDVAYGTEAYRFYGSLTPSVRRTLSNYLVGLSLTSSKPAEAVAFKSNLDYRYHTVTDSAAETKQHRVTLGIDAELPLNAVTLLGTAWYDNATITGAHSGHLTLSQLSVGTSRYWWKQFFVRGAVHLYAAKGMADQKLTRIYPDVALGYSIANKHLVSISYAGSVGFLDLAAGLEANPYLSMASVFRHADRSRQIRFSVESDWTDALKTKASAGYEYVNDYGLYADPLGTGVWSPAYFGKTTLWTFQVEGFAKLSANDYVGGKVTVNSTENDATALPVPYIPEFEVSGSYTHRFPFGVSVSPGVSYQHRRESGLFTSLKLPEVFLVNVRADYEPLTPLRLFVDLHNITNEKYELWKGYQAPPLMITGGVSFRW